MKIILVLSVLLNVVFGLWSWASYRAIMCLLDDLYALRWLEDEMEIGSVDLLIGEEGPCFKVWKN